MPASADLSVAEARSRPQRYPEFFVDDADPEPVGSVHDRTVDGPGGPLHIRVYDPELDDPRPILVYLHGGGWVLGNLEARDDFCRAWANETGHVVVNVDYRLAPENPFPAGLEDARAAVRWAHSHAGAIGGDADRLVVGGDSAGGNLAAATALLTRDRGGPEIAHQLLVYPVTDYGFDTASHRAFADGYFLTRENMEWYWDHYLSHDLHGANPYVSPLRAPSLGALPPATVLTCGFDPLRDEGAAYAERLSDAGVPVTHLEYESMIHGFLTFFHLLDAARDAVVEMAAAVRSGLDD